MRRKILISFLLLSLFIFPSCKNKSPFAPEETKWEFKYNVSVIYKRNPEAIRTPEADDKYVRLEGELWNPKDYCIDHINIFFTKLEENKFICYIPKIWKNAGSSTFHDVRVYDPKIGSPDCGKLPPANASVFTGEGIEIEGLVEKIIYPIESAYPQCPNGTGLRFKIK